MIDNLADEAKDLLFNKHKVYDVHYFVKIITCSIKGGPYPIEFIMEILMDRYRNNKATPAGAKKLVVLEKGETINRAAFRKLWPKVAEEVAADARISEIERTFEGKVHKCWRVIGGEQTVISHNITGDFPVDDYGQEDRFSTSTYTPAKVEGKGFSFI
jgi:hypothetical protein